MRGMNLGQGNRGNPVDAPLDQEGWFTGDFLRELGPWQRAENKKAIARKNCRILGSPHLGPVLTG
jgi:hypothetical protein